MAFLANPTARFQHYASPDGTSAGPGGVDTPWATIDEAIAAVPATCTAVGGATGSIKLVGTTASPNTYVSTAGITIAGTLTIEALEPLGATVAGNGSTQAILLATGANLTLRDVVVDPSLNNGGAADRGITVPLTASVISLTLDSVKFQNWKTYAVTAPSGCRINHTETDCTYTADSVSGGLYLNSYTAGAFVASGSTMTITNQNLVGSGGYALLGGTGSTATGTFTNTNVSVSLDPTLAGAGRHYGIRFNNMVGTVTGGTHSIASTAGPRSASCVDVSWNLSNVITGSQIKNATGYNNTAGGYVFSMGQEVGNPHTGAQNCVISGNTASAGSRAIAGGVHLAFMGCMVNGTISNNVLLDGGISLVDKNSDGHTVTGNTITGFGSSALRIKGSVNSTHSNNTVTQTAGYGSGTCVIASWDDGSTNVTSNLTMSGNTFTNAGGTSTLFMRLDNDGSSANTPTNNVYNQSSGTLIANPWTWLNSNYATKAAWQAIEPTATGTAP